ncbi:hypothetical protein FQA47_022042 [Oryzias melastigma]|uniref:Uncharacterized protein n=1 Tax=Oryzias melastigma TaxID=30732 RepID=A0A834KYB0_ORYME|nr:hypothetical protein FQA47_022042 [Oryzias melastigma]
MIFMYLKCPGIKKYEIQAVIWFGPFSCEPELKTLTFTVWVRNGQMLDPELHHEYLNQTCGDLKELLVLSKQKRLLVKFCQVHWNLTDADPKTSAGSCDIATATSIL